MFRPSRTFSYSPSFKGFSQDDFPLQRRPFQQDDFRGSPTQKNGMFRPSGKSIYMQRKEYSETLDREAETHFRVEHLLTCELDGRELKTLDNCLAKLKRLDGKGRLWPQQMIMEVHRGYLVLSDIETKAELEAIPMRWVLESRAVLDSCAYNSVLTITVDERSKRSPQVYMFQCEETGAEFIKADLDKIHDYRGGLADDDGGVEARTAQPDFKINLENIIGKHFRQPEPYIMPREKPPPPLPDFPPPQWREPEMLSPSWPYSPQDYSVPSPDFQDPQRSSAVPSPVQLDGNNNTEIFNHILDDLEIFLNKIAVATSAKQERSQKKKKSKKASLVILPPIEEYILYLQKVKYGFNLLAQLEGMLSGPNPSDFVHILFSGLAMVVPLYPAEVPPSVIPPLLTVGALQLLSQSTNNEERQLWASLGDSWNISRSSWREDIPPYIPEFYDGWQPPAPVLPPYQNPSSQQLDRGNSQRFPPGRREQEQPSRDEPWNSQPPRSSEPPLYARAIYDFTARNGRELSVTKGDVVQVVKRSNHWWLIRSRGDEGSVPQNVLELINGSSPVEDQQWNPRGAVTLDMNSTPPEVKAWLEHKGFSKITVNTLGVLTGKLLLGMTKEEIRTVCPEEGSKVFFQLQSVKSAMALASEQPGRRY